MDRQPFRLCLDRGQVVGSLEGIFEVIDGFLIGKELLGLLTCLQLIAQPSGPIPS